jgi:hypothetical protein
MSEYNAGQEVEVRAELYPAIGVPVYAWHKARIVCVFADNKCQIEFPDGMRTLATGDRAVFDERHIRAVAK